MLNVVAFLLSAFVHFSNPGWAEEPFLWGVASASFQVEGSPADSDWRRWTLAPGRIKDGTTAADATGFWERYDEDFALAQGIGLNAFRISLAWERIEPEEGKFDEAALEHYRLILAAMKARGLEPVITLFHWALPGWLADQHGVLAKDFAQKFARYEERAVQALAPSGVKYWITLNEPMVMVLAGYLDGRFPPGEKNLAHAMRAAAVLAESHIKAVEKIRALAIPGLQLSIAHNWVVMEPQNPKSPVDKWLSGLCHDLYDTQFVEAIQTGKLNFGLGGINFVHRKIPVPNGGTLDFLGLNYYFRNLIAPQIKPPFFDRITGHGQVSDLGWEIYPEGFALAIKEAYQRWRLPVMITENGIADARDTMRADYLESHLKAMNDARSAGVPVLGYLHWSLTDNFEWAEGQSARFGLVEIDYADRGARKPRASYHRYGELIKEYGVSR